MSKKELDELNEEEIFGDDEIEETEMDLDDDEDMLEDDGVIYDEDEEDDDYDYITADDIPDYTVKSILSILLCLPLGIVTLVFAKKSKEALREDHLHYAIENADKAGLFFKLSIFFAVVIIAVGSFAGKGLFSSEEPKKEVPIKVEQSVKVEPEWEKTAKRLVTLEKTFKVKNGFYRYYMSQEISDDEVLGFRYNEAIEKHHYMTIIEGDSLYVLIYDLNTTPDTDKVFRMDLDFNIDKYGFEKK